MIDEKLAGLDVLAVDDDKIYLTCWKLGFGKECNKFDTAMDERNALNLLERNNYDVVITDGSFPEYEGADYINGHYRENSINQHFRGKNIAKLAKEKGAYVIGISEEPKRLRCKSIDRLMKKPVDVNELKKIFQNINERRLK